jgi:hypothetical protein
MDEKEMSQLMAEFILVRSFMMLAHGSKASTASTELSTSFLPHFLLG